jgi:hypothetical protein
MMRSGWIRAFVLFAAAVLIANAQCYGACATVTCGSAQTPAGSCHHNKSSHESNAGCVHQHSEFTSPEAGVAKVNVATAIPILAVLTTDVTIAAPEQLHLSQAEIGSPPGGRILTTISVLRI